MNLSISNLAWNLEDNDAVYSLMQKYGFTGLEIAPTKIFSTDPYSQLEQVASWASALKSQYTFCIPSIQSIWYGRIEKLFGTEVERKTLLDYTKSAIDFASAIECKNLVFGCPKNRTRPENADESIAIEFFKELGDYAFSKATCIGLEANPEIYGTNFVNTTSQALELIKQVDSEGFKLNLDIGTMIQNEEPVSLLYGNTYLLNHVHISEPLLKKIEVREIHRELFNFLRFENYKGFISIEIGLQNSISDIEDVIKYVASTFS